ncbi:MAG: Ig-like domain-containing protein [Elusimicrobiota bacterium]
MKQERMTKKSRETGAMSVGQVPSVTIDFPTEGETVVGNSYTFRIGAPDNAERVEVSINKGSWQACRQDGGYWWHDWSGFAPGKYQLRARMFDKDSNEHLSPVQKFQVKNPD